MGRRNCHRCDLAKDGGDRFHCRWKDDRLKDAARQAPFPPVFVIRVTRMAVAKDKVPERDCPAFKERRSKS
jgi:hypothetical protein